MTHEMRKAYKARVYLRYQKSNREEKGRILDEFCEVCDYSRKYAIALLNQPDPPGGKRLGPKVKYNTDVEYHLVCLWNLMGRMCSKKMVAAFPLWLPFYEGPEGIKPLLLEISASTIDRILRPYRRSNVRGISSTQPSLLKNKIPIKLLDEDIKEPGFIEADTVAHCGNSLSGDFINSLTMTDLSSAWTENRATWTKESRKVRAAIADIERSLPFPIQGFASDNGNEFFNHELHDYFYQREQKVEIVRRRPYKKNDNAHVEQKNWTHVRELFGYERFDHPDLVDLMNEIYKHYWNPLWNFFTPVMKLKSKTREGGKLIKKHDKPKTPYQRLLESESLSEQNKTVLKARYQRLNPFTLKLELEKKLKWFFKISEINKQKKLGIA